MLEAEIDGTDATDCASTFIGGGSAGAARLMPGIDSSDGEPIVELIDDSVIQLTFSIMHRKVPSPQTLVRFNNLLMVFV